MAAQPRPPFTTLRTAILAMLAAPEDMGFGRFLYVAREGGLVPHIAARAPVLRWLAPTEAPPPSATG